MPDPSDDRRVSDDLRILTEVASLENVYLYHVQADLEGADEDGEPAAPDFQLRIDVEDLPLEDPEVRRSRFHLKVTVPFREGQIVVEPAGEFHVPAQYGHLLDMPTRMEFANEVAVMVLLPFAREAIADLSLRVFQSPVIMPAFARGAITFEAPDSETTDGHD